MYKILSIRKLVFFLIGQLVLRRSDCHKPSDKQIRECEYAWTHPCGEFKCQKESANHFFPEWPLNNSTNNELQSLLKLNNLKIAGIGDSIGEQTFTAQRCYISRSSASLSGKLKVKFRRFVPLHTIFIHRDELYQYLKEALVDIDIAFIHVGTWYQNRCGEGNTVTSMLPPQSASSSYYDDVFRLLVNDSLVDLEPAPITPNTFSSFLERSIPKGTGKEFDDCHQPAAFWTELEYARCRRSPTGSDLLLGKAAFASDFRLLNEVLKHDRETENALPPIIWKEIPAQHFPFTSSGAWSFCPQMRDSNQTSVDDDIQILLKTSSSIVMGDDVTAVAKPYSCRPIKDEANAYNLNEVANEILKSYQEYTAPITQPEGEGMHNHEHEKFCEGPCGSFEGVVHTWNVDVKSWDKHPNEDCSHYCSQSETVMNWGKKMTLAMTNIRSIDKVIQKAIEREGIVKKKKKL